MISSSDQKHTMKALKRNSHHHHHQQQQQNSSTTSSSSSSLPSWIHLRSALLIVAQSSSSTSTSSPSSSTCSPSSACSSSPVSSSLRGSLKSPWSHRRRKHVLLPKQWKSLFTPEGRLVDGGVKLLKKVRSGGVDPRIRAEVWPFLLGVHDLNSSEEERESVKLQKRKEYEDLRRRCLLMMKCIDKKSKETAGNGSRESSRELSQGLESSILEEAVGISRPLSTDGEWPEAESPDQPIYDESPKSMESMCQRDGEITLLSSELISGDKNVVTCEDGFSGEIDSSESDDSSEETMELQPFFISGEIEENDFPEGLKQMSNSLEKENELKAHIDENFAQWQKIIRLDAIRAHDDWIIYSPALASISLMKARKFAKSVRLKDFDNLEPCRIYHAARLVAILEAYALYDPEIGYCQGMSDLLNPIISVIEDDYEAFWCFVGFMKKARNNFRLDEAGIQRQLKIVSKIIKSKDIQLYRHLEKLQAEDCFFVYRMVLVLFRRELTFEQTLCLWEVMWADQAAIRAGIAKSAWGKMRIKAPPTDDLLLYAIAASVLKRRKLIIEMYSSMDEIMRECQSMAGHLDVWKLLDDAHDLVVILHEKIE